MTPVPAASVTRALLVRLHARPGKQDDVERLLADGRGLVDREPATTAWFALHLGPSRYAIFDAFADEAGRSAHLSGELAAQLLGRADELFTQAPEIVKVDVLAAKLPDRTPARPVTKGLRLTFRPRAGHEQDAADFFTGAKALVDREPGTLAWFAIRLENGDCGIFDVFPGHRARLLHLTGHVPRQLARHAPALVGSLPTTSLSGVIAAKLGS